MRLTPNLSFGGQGEAAFKFYKRGLGGKIECIMPYESRPAEYPVPAEWRKKILHVTLRVGNQVLMGADVSPDRYQKPQGFSVTLGLKDQVEADVQEGRKVGVAGTPSFFINGIFLNGSQALTEFEKIIDAQLATSGQQHASLNMGLN